MLVPPRQGVGPRLDHVWQQQQPPSRAGVTSVVPGRVSATLGVHSGTLGVNEVPSSHSLGVEMLRVDAKALHSRLVKANDLIGFVT